MKSLTDLLEVLVKSKIEFVVVGGFAGVLHGSSLVTRDLDVCTVLTPENIERLRETLRDFHPWHRMTPNKLSFLTAPPAGQYLDNLYLMTDLGTVDFLSSIKGVGEFKRVHDQAEEIEIRGHKIKVIGLEDLISAKEAINRDKDILAAKELRAIQAKKRS